MKDRTERERQPSTSCAQSKFLMLVYARIRTSRPEGGHSNKSFAVSLLITNRLPGKWLAYAVHPWLRLFCFGGTPIPRTERIRRAVLGQIDPAELESFRKQGWKLVALEWERDSPEDEPHLRPAPAVENLPFGLRVKDASTLESDPKENQVLITMMELLIQDGPYSFIADELNRRGYRTREGAAWSPVSVFQMLPRLIEAGPSIFSTEEWRQRRQVALQRTRRLPV